jgi:hypothetical protein
VTTVAEDKSGASRVVPLQEGAVAQNSKAPKPRTKPVYVGGSSKKKQ